MSRRTKLNKGTKDWRKIHQFKRTGNYYYLEANSKLNPKKLRNVTQVKYKNLNHPTRLILSAVVDYHLTKLTGHQTRGVN